MSDKPIAFEAYEELADAYAEIVETKPHNAYYDKPAVISLLPELNGLKVLDAGCGTGAYSKTFIEMGAKVTGIEVSPNMIEHAKRKLGNQATLYLADLNEPLEFLKDSTFDIIVSPLVIHYIKDLKKLFNEFNRILKKDGVFVFSTSHPYFDYQYYKSKNYFSKEKVGCHWGGFKKKVYVPCYRYPLQYLINSLINANFTLDYLLEPLPTEEFKDADVKHYNELKEFPGFMCIRAIKKH
jgi:ubiquinone/menaquinone biosynthesis C-methylase UbiE